jgi:hypothetical protein
MVSEREQVVSAVEAYLSGLGGCDLSKVPFDEDVSIRGPLEPGADGREAVVELLTGIFPLIKGITIRDHIVEPPFCATVFDFETVFGTVEVFDRFRVEGGRLKQIRPYYDPRLITEAMATAS